MASATKMKVVRRTRRYRALFGVTLLLAVAFLAVAPELQALTLNVVDSNGQPVNRFQWVVEEDVTYHPIAGFTDPDPLSLNFHRSYMPVIAAGDETTVNQLAALDPSKYYYVSVLPDAGYTNGGVAVAPNQTSATAIVNQLPLPTAQINVFIFEDTYPINNAPDLPQERGLEGFTIIVEEAGGRYGASGGLVLQDAFGNPLGTTYFPNGDVDQIGTSVIKSDVNGYALIKYLPPGKYGLRVSPPAVGPTEKPWIQTSTIEGSRVIDAWVKANEPPYFTEFGPAGPHCAFGFVREMNDATVLTGGATITGQVVNTHMSRPPDYRFYPGNVFPGAWIGLNDMSVGLGRGVYAAPCGPNSTFSIPNVPPGTYQLAVWDDNLNIIFASLAFIVNEGDTNIDLGQVAVFDWFGHLIGSVFFDTNEDGFPDPGEAGLPDQAVNIRWRDGSVYLATATDSAGNYVFDQVFPFFNWLVAEVDFARFKATGATIVVDAGGEVLPDQGWTWPSRGRLTPQSQPENVNKPYRTETGEVLTQAFQVFLGQTNEINWGKANYAAGENGGISGIVFYDTTRAENDPRFNFGENWQPGIPRVQVVLYQDATGDGVIDDLNGSGGPTLADVDNYPFQWTGQLDPTHPDYTGVKGPEDVDHLNNGTFDPGDALQITWTDSWDDSLPDGCPPGTGGVTDPFYQQGKCYDGLRNFNQVRPGVFDGGYAFASYHPGGMASGSAEVEGLPTGIYIVQTAPPPGYELVKEESKNVDFGDDYAPSPLALPPVCVGDSHVVPAYLTLFPDDMVPAPFAGQQRPLCDRKQVPLEESKNAPADFFLFTPAPVSGRIKGMILNDLANEFDPNNPTFGEKFAPKWLPISVRDWQGNEISRVYTDQYGQFNILVPSTYSTNIPSPSGMSPNMLVTCMNDPGPIADPANPGQFITDPYYQLQYSTFCYTFQYMPGVTTYLDTPVLPIAAFAGPNQLPLDCEFPEGTPVIKQVQVPGRGGPYIGTAGEVLQINSMGNFPVPNPAYNETAGTPQTIHRDYGFGDAQGTGTVQLVTADGTVYAMTVNSWTGASIEAVLPGGFPANEKVEAQLVVTRGDNGRTSKMGVTVTADLRAIKAYGVIPVNPGTTPGATPIQNAIDLSQPGDIILVGPGIYNELVILHKDVKLQGQGAPVTTINAVKAPGEKLQQWRDKVTSIVNSGEVDLLPNQDLNINLENFALGLLNTAEGPGVLVLAPSAVNLIADAWTAASSARIDGFTITGSDMGGAVTVNGYANYLEISNNRMIGNHGLYAGGVRIGHPFIGDQLVDGQNDFIRIHHNHITQNGATTGGAGGIGVFTGTDQYRIDNNYLCGNFTTGDGGGIGHHGRSDQGRIENNEILFNQAFTQLGSSIGGGIAVRGMTPVGGGISEGSGSVSILANLIQGNLTGAGDGGGIALALINGLDVQNNLENDPPVDPGDPVQWYSAEIINNMIVNNVAGLAAGGISVQDALQVKILYNTVANNDSTATAGEAFTPGNPPGVSSPLPAGIVARAHTNDLAALPGLPADQTSFSNPELVNNIIWHNRSFHWDVTANGGIGGLLPDPSAPVYSDLAVFGTTGSLSPQNCLLTNPADYPGAGNIAGPPEFGSEYVNSGQGLTLIPEDTTPLNTAAAIDEGGNYIDVRFGPLSPVGDYHVLAGSPVIDQADGAVQDWSGSGINVDFDGDSRASDIGADEYTAPGSATGANITWATSGGSSFAGSPSSAPAGTAVVFMAGGLGDPGVYEYRFLLDGVEVQAWSTVNFWVWVSTVADVVTSPHGITVEVRIIGDAAVGTPLAPINFTITDPAVITASILPVQTSPQAAGAAVQFTASPIAAPGTTGYQYKFTIIGPATGGVEQIMQDYGVGLNPSIFTWNTSTADIGTTEVKVYIRNVGSIVESTDSYFFTIQPATGALTLTPTFTPPNVPGKPITFTASGYQVDDPLQLQYRFSIRRSGTTAWTEVQAYGPAASWIWDPTAAPPVPTQEIGSYEVKVEVKNVNSQFDPLGPVGSDYDAQAIRSFSFRSPGGGSMAAVNMLLLLD